MFGQKIMMDGEWFLLTLPTSSEATYLHSFIRDKHNHIFHYENFDCLTVRQYNLPMTIFSCHGYFKYSPLAVFFESGQLDCKDSLAKTTDFAVFPKMIPLDSNYQCSRLNKIDYPDGTITYGGQFTFDRIDDHLECNSKEPHDPGRWGMHIPEGEKLPHSSATWMAIDGILFAVTACWKTTLSDLVNRCPWQYYLEIPRIRYEQYQR